MNTLDPNTTDVEFKEVAVPVQDPVAYLTNALVLSGYSNPSGWERGLNPAARDPNVDIEQRQFLVNRSLGLFLSEVTDCGDNVIPRMFISEKQTYSNWCKIIDEGVVPWLNKRFDAKGMLIREAAPEVIQQEVGPLVSEEPLEIVADPEADNQAVVAAEIEINVDPKNFISGERFVQDVEKPERQLTPEGEPIFTEEEKKKIILLIDSDSEGGEHFKGTVAVGEYIVQYTRRFGAFLIEYRHEESPEVWHVSQLLLPGHICKSKVTDHKVGQVVVLKSGGPEMTITKIEGYVMTCEWVDDNGVKQSHNFAKETVIWPRGKNPHIAHIDEAAFIAKPE